MPSRKHETKKCFPSKCRKCGAKVLYWESTAGAKVFFNLPIYGKPRRHLCNPNKKKTRSMVIESHHEHLQKRLKKQITYQCPVCAKIFDKEGALNKHIKDLKNYDDKHAQFFEKFLDLLSWEEQDPNLEDELEKSPFKTQNKIQTMNDRFILKTHSKKDKKKFERLAKGRSSK